MKPNDPLCRIWDCCLGEEDEPGVGISTAPRAAAQRRYADERGVSFQEVQCLRVYVHIYTRQEAWDDYGREREQERRQEEKGIGWYFSPQKYGSVARGVTVEGYYYDDVDEHGLHQPVSDEDEAYIECPDAVPDDWEPEEGGYAWYRSNARDPTAIPAWECSLF